MNDIDLIVDDNLRELIDNLKIEGVDVDLEDIHYSIMNREEWIYIKSELVYPTEDIPDQFGVYRGYGGGGVHNAPITTQIERMSKRRQAKAQRILDLFKNTLTEILKEIDGLTDPEVWDGVSI